MNTSEAVLAHEALSDSDLVARACRGEAVAFGAIMRRYNRRLYRVVRSVLGSDAEAEDVLQEAYVRAFRGLQGFRADSSLPSWLTRIALNEALGHLRRRRPAASLDMVGDGGFDMASRIVPFPSADEDPERRAARHEIRRVLEQAIDELPEAFRAVFVLRAVEQLSVEETAACLGIPGDTVKSRFHRGRALLRRQVTERLGAELSETFPFAGARCARVAERVLERLGLPPALRAPGIEPDQVD